jgi:hypothetical protein
MLAAIGTAGKMLLGDLISSGVKTLGTIISKKGGEESDQNYADEHRNIEKRLDKVESGLERIRKRQKR